MTCRPKTGWLSGKTYCAVHGRAAGWPCTASPPHPEGAHLLHSDGSTTPLELVYEGVDADGIHIWSATTLYHPGHDKVHVAVLPARTGIVLRLPTPDSEDPF